NRMGLGIPLHLLLIPSHNLGTGVRAQKDPQKTVQEGQGIPGGGGTLEITVISRAPGAAPQVPAVGITHALVEAFGGSSQSNARFGVSLGKQSSFDLLARHVLVRCRA